MKTLRAMALAATLAAVCVLPVLAGPDGDPGPCVPGTPSCPLAPPQSIQVNPHPLNADGTSVEVPTSGALVPVEAVAPMPAPRFVDPLALGSEGGSSPGRPSGSADGTYSGIAGSDGDLEMGAEGAGSSGAGGAAAGSVGTAQALALAGLGAMGVVATASPALRGQGFGRSPAGRAAGRATRVGGSRAAGSRGGNSAPKDREERMLPRASWIPGASSATSGQGGAAKALYSIVPPPPTPIVQTPTTTESVPTPTYGPGTPTQTEGPQATSTPTPSPSSTPTYVSPGQEIHSPTPTVSNTPTPYYQALITPGTPAAAATQAPGAWATEIAEGRIYSQATERGFRLGDSFARLGNISWPTNYQLPGLVSSALALTGLWRHSNGASELELQGYRLGGKVSDWAGSLGLAAYTRNLAGLPTAGQIVRSAAQVAAEEGGVFGTMKGFLGELGNSAGKELAAIGGNVIPKGLSLTNLAIRGLQIAGSVGGVVGGVFQAKEGFDLVRSGDNGAGMVGRVQMLGGLSTIGGSAITLGAAVGFITIPAIIGAAPVLLGAGAIAAAGTLAYKYLKDKGVDKSFERWVGQPGGFEDTAIKVGQRLKGGLDAWGGIAHNGGTIVRTLTERAKESVSTAGNRLLAAAGGLVGGLLKQEPSPRPNAPFSLPKVSMPKFSLPKVTLPKITLPKIIPPKVTLPKITLPKIALPKITLPKITPPKVTLPKLTFPKITLPKVTLPKLTLPKITLPKTAPAKITPIKVTSSKPSPPKVTTSRPSPPTAKPAPKPSSSLSWRR